MRTAYAITVALLLAIAAASVVALDDQVWVAPDFLFWLVVIAASGCVVAAAYVARLAHRLDQLELGIVASFFFGGSMLPLVHGITTPGVLYGENAATMTSVCLAIPVGAATAGFVAYGPGRWRVRMNAGAALVTVLSAVLLAIPSLRVFPDPGSVFGVAYALAAFGISIGFGWRHVRLAEIAMRPQPLVVAVGYALLGASALVFLGASTWSTYFWLAHAVDIVGVFLATIGALVVYHRHGSITSIMAPITVVAPRQAFEIGLSPVVHRFVADLEAKDQITRDHVVRAGSLAVDVATELGLSAADIRRCGLVGLLHDVGKLEIPDEVLQKPSRLTDDEFAVMKRHAEIGSELVSSSAVLADLAPAVRGHHERIDGRGYPDGIAGESIPIVARVVSVCDSYDAMSFTRHYREGMGPDRVRSILLEHAGAQWDPQVVDALLRVVDRRTDDDTWALDRVGRAEAAHAGHTPIGCDCLPTLVGVGPEAPPDTGRVTPARS